MTNLATATIFAHLDDASVLSRGLANKGICLTVDPLDSALAMLQPLIVDKEHYETTQKVLKVTCKPNLHTPIY